MRKIVGIFASILFFTAAVNSYCANPDPQKIMKNVEKTLNNLTSLKCSFERSFPSGGQQGQKIAGTLFLKKPYSLHVETASQIITVAGDTVWLYLPKANQVQVSKFNRDKEAFPTPQSLFNKYSKGKTFEYIGMETLNGRQCDVIKILPTRQGEKEAAVWIDRNISFPVKTIEKGSNGENSVYLLTDVTLNGKIDKKVFIFTPPKDAEIVDMRE